MYTRLITYCLATCTAACVMGAGAASGQTVPKVCGQQPHAEATLARLASIFVDDEMAWFQDEHNIQQLSADAEMAVVAEPRVCGRVVGALRRALAEIDKPPPSMNEIEYAIFRYGPYYAVLVTFTPPDDPDIAVTGYDPFYIFDAETLELLGWILV